MKKTTLFFFQSLLLLSAGCDRQLDLSPQDTLVDREVFSNEGGTEQVLADAYLKLFRAATASISYVMGDFTTDNVQHSLFYNIYEDGSVPTADEPVQTVWENYYRAVNAANTVIEKVPLFAQYTTAKQEQFIAEARFIRAYAYLDLLKLYGDGALSGAGAGLGVPLQLTPFKGYDTEESNLVPRATNAEVFARILADLTEPAASLPQQHSNDLRTRSRATQGAAAALRARTLLYMHRYDEAVAATTEVLQFRPAVYQLAQNLLTLFPYNTDGTAKTLVSEYLFAFPVSHITSPSTTGLNNNLGNGYFFKRSFWADPAFVAAFESGDRRRTQLIFKGDSVFNPDQFAQVTTFKFNNSNGRDNVSALRLAEVLLTRAEALARTGGMTAEAVSLLNQVRSRSVPDAVPFAITDFASAEQLVDRILRERRFELAFEGHYRYDRIRTGHPPRDNNLSRPKWALPIPQREVDVSGGVIAQNPGYVQ